MCSVQFFYQLQIILIIHLGVVRFKFLRLQVTVTILDVRHKIGGHCVTHAKIPMTRCPV